MVDRGGDGWCDASQADFADTTGAVLSHDGIGNVEEVNIDIRRVSDCGNDVVGEVVVDGMTATRVVGGLLEQPHAYSHDDRPRHLVGRCALVDDATAINDTDDSTNAQLCNARVPFDFDELRAEGVGGVVA